MDHVSSGIGRPVVVPDGAFVGTTRRGISSPSSAGEASKPKAVDSASQGKPS